MFIIDESSFTSRKIHATCVIINVKKFEQNIKLSLIDKNEFQSLNAFVSTEQQSLISLFLAVKTVFSLDSNRYTWELKVFL